MSVRHFIVALLVVIAVVAAPIGANMPTTEAGGGSIDPCGGC